MSKDPEDLYDDDTLEHDKGFPVHRSQLLPEDIPEFLNRAVDHLRERPDADDFALDGVDFETTAAGVWIAPVGVYDPDYDTPSTPEQIAAGESPTGPWGNRMLDWADRAQRAMRRSWGEPFVHTPQLVGEAEEPEGVLDYVLLSQDFAQAELWDRREVFVALLTEWAGQPAGSLLRQVVLILPREVVMQGMGAYLADDTAQELLMHGEHPLELQRRAWLLSTVFGRGESRVRDAPIEATRCTLQSTTGRTTTWIFADDGRQLLLIQDPACDFAKVLEDREGEEDPEARLILIDRLLNGVPDDLRACIAAPGETGSGDVAEHVLEFGTLAGRPVPIISGAFWFDGAVWQASPGLLETGYQHGLTIDGFGFAEAVRRPFRLGGAFTPETLAPSNDPEHRVLVQPVFDLCRYPEQPRPEGYARLGYGIPVDIDHAGLVEALERASAAWWDEDPPQQSFGDSTFTIGGCRLTGGKDDGVLDTVLATAEHWTVDELQKWVTDLSAVMTERWGQSRTTSYDAQRPGIDHRTPLTDIMRSTGLAEGPLWWVNGHAVVLLAGYPDPEYSEKPQVILAVCRADAVIELIGRMNIWETRRRARIVESLADLVRDVDEPPADRSIAWQGPALQGSGIVPAARRIALRAGDFLWVFRFAHDGRGLLTSHRTSGGSAPAADPAELLDGVPDDLRSLLADERAERAYPPVAAVFTRQGGYWHASDGMLRRAYAGSLVGGPDPLTALYSEDHGVPQLRRVLPAWGSMSPRELSEPEYAEYALGQEVSVEEASAAVERLGTRLSAALTGSLSDFFEAPIEDEPGLRYVLDAALSTLHPRDRREKSLWMLENDAKPLGQLSFMTPVNVLLANPTLDAGDAAVLARLLEMGAEAGPGLLGPSGIDPLLQLESRGLPESEAAPLRALLQEHREGAAERP